MFYLPNDLRKQGVNKLLEQVTQALCSPSEYIIFHQELQAASPMPSLEQLHEILSRLRSALFPGYFDQYVHASGSLQYHMAANLDSVFYLMKEQIRRGFCFASEAQRESCAPYDELANDKALQFIGVLPHIRNLLASDVKAAYEGDPAAQSPSETIFCYPSVAAMTNHRIAHCLYMLGVPLIPRILSEMAHAATGIDIHPGATIGEEFFIDHGTGVVIGETCIIGRKCRLYQGVTLGALSFQKDEDGLLVKGKARHPILEDNITVYAGATILGRITIGANSIIGGNVWLTHSVPQDSRILQQHSRAPAASDAMVGDPLKE